MGTLNSCCWPGSCACFYSFPHSGKVCIEMYVQYIYHETFSVSSLFNSYPHPLQISLTLFRLLIGQLIGVNDRMYYVVCVCVLQMCLGELHRVFFFLWLVCSARNVNCYAWAFWRFNSICYIAQIYIYIYIYAIIMLFKVLQIQSSQTGCCINGHCYYCCEKECTAPVSV